MTRGVGRQRDPSTHDLTPPNSGERDSARDVVAGSIAKHDARPWAKAIRDGKICSKCKCTKPAGEFVANARARDRLSSWCRLCQVEATRSWRTENASEINAKRRAAYREAHPARQCSECGAPIASSRVICGLSKCKTARAKRLDPEGYRERERLKVERRRDARRKARERVAS
jgi:hypothetical protein